MRRNWFDGLMLVWALVTVLMIGHVVSEQGIVFAYDAQDDVMLPTCEACRLIDPNHCWTCWSLFYLNGCASC